MSLDEVTSQVENSSLSSHICIHPETHIKYFKNVYIKSSDEILNLTDLRI